MHRRTATAPTSRRRRPLVAAFAVGLIGLIGAIVGLAGAASGNTPGSDTDSAPKSAPESTADQPATRPRGRIVRVTYRPSDMVRVPAGPFTMGLSHEEKAHFTSTCVSEFNATSYVCREDWFGIVGLGEREVELDAFAIDRYEVTVARYRECAAAGGCDIAALVAGDERYLRDDLPMANVTWSDAVAYCQWAGKRLPSEAEWEKAARGADGRRYPHGNSRGIDEMNYDRTYGQVIELFGPDPVGFHARGVSPHGVYDMSGNVWEMLSTGQMRGGSFFQRSLDAHTYNHQDNSLDGEWATVGFRVCAPAPAD